MNVGMVEHADYGLFQLVGVPGGFYYGYEGETSWGVPVWNGDHVSHVCPERLRPLDRLARELLRTNYSGPFWKARRK